jgi:glycosyltransferase involved in cell wall biosynthesis
VPTFETFSGVDISGNRTVGHDVPPFPAQIFFGMNALKLSLVLCTYNGEAYLAEQLESVLGQTRLPDEVVIGDDGSIDATWSILESFTERATKRGISVQLVRQPKNVGFVINFSDALRAATGDVLFLCDQDDVWYPEKLEVMGDRFARDPQLLMLATDARLIDASGAPLGLTAFAALGLSAEERAALHQDRGFEVLLRRSLMTGATAALRRSVLPMALPVGSGWIHDEWLAVVLAAVGRVDIIEQPLIDYRQHANNQVGMRRRGWSDWWRDMTSPRRQQFEADLVRMRGLASHLAVLDDAVPDAHMRAIESRMRHFQARLELGRDKRLARLPAVWREWRLGNYRRFGTGWRSALRDVLRHD